VEIDFDMEILYKDLAKKQVDSLERKVMSVLNTVKLLEKSKSKDKKEAIQTAKDYAVTLQELSKILKENTKMQLNAMSLSKKSDKLEEKLNVLMKKL
jgi:hypothetical protein